MEHRVELELPVGFCTLKTTKLILKALLAVRFRFWTLTRIEKDILLPQAMHDLSPGGWCYQFRALL